MELKHKTPLLDELESGPWPSFVSDLKREAISRKTNEKGIDYQCPAEMPEDLLGVVELSYEHGRTHWKHGGIVGVFGYGGGVIGRYCDQPRPWHTFIPFASTNLPASITPPNTWNSS